MKDLNELIEWSEIDDKFTFASVSSDGVVHFTENFPTYNFSNTIYDSVNTISIEMDVPGIEAGISSVVRRNIPKRSDVNDIYHPHPWSEQNV